MSTAQADHPLLREYLRLGLSFDRIEEGFVDAFTGDPALRREIENASKPDPRTLADTARGLLGDLPASGLPAARAEFIGAHLRALECSARKFAGEQIGFVDEVSAYFDVGITMGDPGQYRQAHAKIAEVVPGPGPLLDRVQAYRRADEIPPAKLAECVNAFSVALRELVRDRYPLPDDERVQYEVVGDKPWSGFNYYLGNYQSRVAINSDLPQFMSNLPHLIAHEAYPGHHTEHCRKEAGLVAAGQAEQTIFLVNTPQCLMAEGLADLALHAIVGENWGLWAQEIYADLGLRFDGERAQRMSAASAQLLGVRQDAALLLHDRHAGEDAVADFLQRWSLTTPQRARQSLRFLSSPLWRAYISTYVEGYRLLRSWLDVARSAGERADRFGRLLDEPLIPATLREELAGHSA